MVIIFAAVSAFEEIVLKTLESHFLILKELQNTCSHTHQVVSKSVSESLVLPMTIPLQTLEAVDQFVDVEVKNSMVTK